MAYRAFFLSLVAIVSTFGVAAGQSHSSSQSDVVPYACNDVVIIGHIRDQTFTPVPDAGDLIGQGRVDMTIDVKRALVGDIAAPTIQASGIAHTFFSRENRDFLLVLRPTTEGRYTVQRGRILDDGDQPPIAKSCR
jgi:hypothetical protein